jgi:integrase/recombinase XerD
MDDISRAWLDYCQLERLPLNTIRRRAAVLRAVGNAGTATREDIEAWWASTNDQAPATRVNALGCLRAFYRWAIVWEHRAPGDDPTYRIVAPKVDKGLPRYAHRHEMDLFIKHAPDDMRRAILLGAWAGLRVSEVASLNWSDVDLEAKRARVTGAKGTKSRLVAIGEALIDRLWPEVPGCNVVTGTDKEYSADVLQRRVNRTMQRIAGRKDITFHQLRHRYGTEAYRATKDLIAVGRQMGHSSPTTTAIYAAASDDVADLIAEAVTR